jgi:hypothetical protein
MLLEFLLCWGHWHLQLLDEPNNPMDAHEVGGGCRLGVVCGGRSHRVCVYIVGQPDLLI